MTIRINLSKLQRVKWYLQGRCTTCGSKKSLRGYYDIEYCKKCYVRDHKHLLEF